jgi:hypothetical protein
VHENSKSQIIEVESINYGAPGFHAVKRRVATLIRTTAAHLAEQRFEPALPPKVLWSNFRSMGFCDSSNFSSLGVSADDFADFFLCFVYFSGYCLV